MHQSVVAMAVTGAATSFTQKIGRSLVGWMSSRGSCMIQKRK